MEKGKWSKWKMFKAIWVSAGIVFVIWNAVGFQSRGLPSDTFESNDLLRVIQTDDMITFEAVGTGDSLEVIFFQGGLTDPKAYAPLCRQLAIEGFTCHIVKMDWRLPQRDYLKTMELFDVRSGRYVVGGHSQGGKMAAQLVYEHPDLFKGLFLLGTSHPRDINMSGLDIPTLKIYAEHDGLASVAEVMENRPMLPSGAEMVMIEGGNHSQFGYLGRLFMDDSANISLEEQQRRTLEALVVWLRNN
jgi:pimeloyl-ACP methyl ester carboxylesterase